MRFPEYALINGERYHINTDFRIALKCFKVINDESISDTERALATLYMLFGFIPDEDAELFMEKAQKFLERGGDGKDGAQSGPKDMDLIDDEAYIYASFMSDYGIDLASARLHWWAFLDLLAGLTDKCALSRVREIRNYDLAEIKDAKTRQKMAQAKQAVALPVHRTKEEQKALEEFEALFAEV